VGGSDSRRARAILLNLAAPWRPRLNFSLPLVRNVLGTGLKFQASELIGSLGGWLTPSWLGRFWALLPLATWDGLLRTPINH
jgi:hypothetical protein